MENKRYYLLCGGPPQASSSPTVQDCIPWTANRPLVRCAVASVSRSFAPSVAATTDATAHPDPLASCVCGVWSQPGWYMGVNPGTWLVGNIPVWNAYGVAEKGVGCGCCELPASFLVLLHVTLPDTELLLASSRDSRAKVSSSDLYKRRSGLGNGISFVYPGKKNTSFLASLCLVVVDNNMRSRNISYILTFQHTNTSGNSSNKGYTWYGCRK